MSDHAESWLDVTAEKLRRNAVERFRLHAIAAATRELEAENERLREIEQAARDSFLVILEAHPEANAVTNAEMRRAADRFRSALRAAEKAE